MLLLSFLLSLAAQPPRSVAADPVTPEAYKACVLKKYKAAAPTCEGEKIQAKVQNAYRDCNMESAAYGDVDQLMALAKNMEKVSADLDPQLSKLAADACPGTTVEISARGMKLRMTRSGS